MSADVPFIGRQSELDYLNLFLRKRTATLIVLKGRRRIGKSRLIEEFAKQHRFLQFVGLAPKPETKNEDQLKVFALQLSQQTQLPVLSFDDWYQAFVTLADKVTSGRVIILLDEISWMGSKDPNFLGILKNVWDAIFKRNPKLMLILCGSVSQWIESNILSSTSLFGRIAQELTLDELPLQDCNDMLAAVGFKGSSYEKFMMLAVMGGIPWYLENITVGLSAIENLKRLCFRKGALLVKEYQKIFHDLFSKQGATCQKIVECLVNAPKEYKEISVAINYSSGGPLSDYLNNLVASGFISQDFTWSIKTNKRINISRYRLRDNYLRFYLKYIAPKLNMIDKDLYKDISVTSLPAWDTVMGLQLENLVINNRILIMKLLNINVVDVIEDNPFYQRKTSRQKGCQIDYLIHTKYKTLYVCEIKSTRSKLNMSIVDDVHQKIKSIAVPKGYVCHPVLIYIGDVSAQLRENDYFYRMIDLVELLEK